jgi:hypothetical protein
MMFQPAYGEFPAAVFTVCNMIAYYHFKLGKPRFKVDELINGLEHNLVYRKFFHAVSA